MPVVHNRGTNLRAHTHMASFHALESSHSSCNTQTENHTNGRDKITSSREPIKGAKPNPYTGKV